MIAGEYPALSEVFVVSPGHGRFQRESIEAGHSVERGAILGVVRDGGPDMLIRSPIDGVLVAWMEDGGRVRPGVPLARVAKE